MKYINFKRFKFSTVSKSLDTLKYNFFKIIKKIYRKIHNDQISPTKVIKYFDLRNYNIDNLKIKNFLSSKFISLHIPIAIIFFGFLYLSIPTFFKYDKSVIENLMCKNNSIECKIKGKVSYKFYPTPRLKIKDVVVNNFSGKKSTFMSIEDISIVLSFKNLLAKEKHKFKKVELTNFEVKIDLKNIKKYKNIFNRKANVIPLFFKKGQIIFFDGANYVASITKTNVDIKFIKDFIEINLKGKFLDDDIFLSYVSDNIDNKISSDIIFKMKNLNFLTKANFFNSKKDKNALSGNFLIKKDKNKITGLFDYKNEIFKIKKSNLKNTFIDGSMKGNIILLPYFEFDLDINLNSINFTRLYNYFLSLDENKQKDLFKINNKINGKINFSTDKVYSKHNVVKSFESRVKLYNGNINIEQFLINLGKLGAADVLGTLNNDKKVTTFKFESNVFVDNKKKFSSKFGIYNKETISQSLFAQGNFDLENIKISFYEILANEKFKAEDINYIETEFNDLMLEDGFNNLFNFSKFKVFLKSVTDEKN
tara:strand:+ start:1127 stop:2734 length:1608 start_codon:yes stop_codon:yes gene_type:complete